MDSSQYERSRRSLPPTLVHSTNTALGSIQTQPVKVKPKKGKLSTTSLLNALGIRRRPPTPLATGRSNAVDVDNSMGNTNSLNDDNNNSQLYADAHQAMQHMHMPSKPTMSLMHQSWHAQMSHSTTQHQQLPQSSNNNRLQSFTKGLRKRLSNGVSRRLAGVTGSNTDIMVTSTGPLTSSGAAATEPAIDAERLAVASTTAAPSHHHHVPRHQHRANSTTCMNTLNDAALSALNWRHRGAYRRLGKLGEGSYASVYKCVHEATNSVVALKEIRLQAEEGLPFTAIREVSLLKGLNHANIVMLHDIILERAKVTLVFEYMETDLSKHLECHPFGLHPHNVKLYLYQLLRGLAFCHDHKILHRDLKPQNLLLNSSGELKLADFGLARARSVPSRTFSHEVVTLWYRPPDVLMGSTQYNTCLDMWGVGCIFAEMVTGCVLFAGSKHVNDQLVKIFAVVGLPLNLPNRHRTLVAQIRAQALSDGIRLESKRRVDWYGVNPKFFRIQYCESLLSNLLRVGRRCNPSERLGAHEAMEHPYFKSMPDRVHLIPKECSLFVLPGVNVVPEPFQPTQHTAC